MNTDDRRIRNKRRGILTFEWILLITVLVIGVVGGVSAVRDAVISEMGDVVGAAVSVDQSYTVNAFQVPASGSTKKTLGNAFSFKDTLPSVAPPAGGQWGNRPASAKTQGPIGPCSSTAH